MQENWLPVGEAQQYLVSDFGRVKKGVRALSQHLNQGGYPRVSLGTARGRFVHRLVALAFIGPPPTDKHEVNHIDGRKTNNFASNLEWVTRSENHIHAYRILGRKNASSGKPAWNAKPLEALLNGVVIHRFPNSYAAKALGFNPGRIRSCASGDGTTHRGMVWRHAE